MSSAKAKTSSIRKGKQKSSSHTATKHIKFPQAVAKKINLFQPSCKKTPCIVDTYPTNRLPPLPPPLPLPPLPRLPTINPALSKPSFKQKEGRKKEQGEKCRYDTIKVQPASPPLQPEPNRLIARTPRAFLSRKRGYYSIRREDYEQGVEG